MHGIVYFYIIPIVFHYTYAHFYCHRQSHADRAAKRAKTERMPLAVVVRVLLTDYAEGRLSIGTRTGHDVTAETILVDEDAVKMDSVVRQWRDRLPA